MVPSESRRRRANWYNIFTIAVAFLSLAISWMGYRVAVRQETALLEIEYTFATPGNAGNYSATGCREGVDGDYQVQTTASSPFHVSNQGGSPTSLIAVYIVQLRGGTVTMVSGADTVGRIVMQDWSGESQTTETMPGVPVTIDANDSTVFRATVHWKETFDTLDEALMRVSGKVQMREPGYSPLQSEKVKLEWRLLWGNGQDLASEVDENRQYSYPLPTAADFAQLCVKS